MDKKNLAFDKMNFILLGNRNGDCHHRFSADERRWL